jgi:uncharacterized protein (TIGR02611 family)
MMALNTVEQVRRVFRVVAGFTLLAAGAVMLITPGPGWLVIFLGLGLLAAEFVWARRWMDRIKREGDRFKDTVFGKSETGKGSDAPTASVDQSLAAGREVRAESADPNQPGSKGIG